MKRLVAIIVGAGIGAAIGYSQVLCIGGQCPLTGSWYGGALVGAVLGLLVTGRG